MEFLGLLFMVALCLVVLCVFALLMIKLKEALWCEDYSDIKKPWIVILIISAVILVICGIALLAIK